MYMYSTHKIIEMTYKGSDHSGREGSDAKPESSFKVIKREDGTEWLEGVNTSDQPIQVTISRPLEIELNTENGKSTTIHKGPWTVAKIQHERNTNKYMEIPCPTDKCKRCSNIRIRIVRDMKLWWVECDQCKTTYQVDNE